MHIFPWGQHSRVPKPFVLGIIGCTIPEPIYHNWRGHQTNDKLVWIIKHNLFEKMGFNPIHQALLPVVEEAINKSLFFDMPIENIADERKNSDARYNPAHLIDSPICG